MVRLNVCPRANHQIAGREFVQIAWLPRMLFDFDGSKLAQLLTRPRVQQCQQVDLLFMGQPPVAAAAFFVAMAAALSLVAQSVLLICFG